MFTFKKKINMFGKKYILKEKKLWLKKLKQPIQK